MMLNWLSMRHVRALGMWLCITAALVASIYLFLRFGALSSPSQSTAYRDITWDDLLEHPSSPSAPMRPGGPPTSLGPDPWAKFSDDIESAIAVSATKKPAKPVQNRKTLDGADVRLAGYIVPLEDSPERAVTEFFLVPYVGACIHVPPPPPDQIVYIKFPMGLRIDNIYQPFQVQGTLHLQALHTGLADTSYMMVADGVSRYDPQTAQ